MTQLANIQIPDRRMLDPFLAKLVNKLALDHPQWIFSWKKPNDNSSPWPLVTQKDAEGNVIKAPDDCQYLRVINVVEQGERLGKIWVNLRYGGRSTTPVYQIESWRIESSRGHRNATTTEKFDIAVRKAKKNFVRMNHDEMMGKAEEAIRNGIGGTLRELREPIYRTSLVKDTVGLQKYVFCMVRGLPIPDEIRTTVETIFASVKYEEHMSQFELANEIDVHQTADNMVYVVNTSGLYLCKAQDDIMTLDFDSLPVAWQERIAVLQLMEDHEVVRDVGYRYNSTHFYIIA
jgi:ribosomal protein S8